jgi:2-oxoglutarate dehydrogenase E2 component (dihydrolipoamide succinyltransferase)
MTVEIRVPSLGESVTEATVAKWFKQVGDSVVADEPLVELETDKVTLEYNAPASGTLAEILVGEGGEVEVGALLGAIEEDGSAAAAGPPRRAAAGAPAAAAPAPASEPAATPARGAGDGADLDALPPSVRKLIDEYGVDLGAITPTGPKGNITKADVLAAVERARSGAAKAPPPTPAPEPKRAPAAAPEPARPTPVPPRPAAPAPAAISRPSPAPAPAPVAAPPPAQPARAPAPATIAAPEPAPLPPAPAGGEERVRMTRLRRRIAERLKEAQNTAAILTTYNEADMSRVMALRARHRAAFEARHGVKLGFMSFFVKAVVNALQALPALNAEIDGDEIVYKHYYDIGVAVGTPSGLVVPVVRGADRLSYADLEKTIAELGVRARDGRLAIEELMGGTFTISNGGVYGSLMSAPILNPPQVGILGMHKIQDRPVAVDGKIEIRPMMYLALSYDHRLVDGREAVTFLVRVKECIEDPERLLLDL